jgi:hypothetical protein
MISKLGFPMIRQILPRTDLFGEPNELKFLDGNQEADIYVAEMKNYSEGIFVGLHLLHNSRNSSSTFIMNSKVSSTMLFTNIQVTIFMDCNSC